MTQISRKIKSYLFLLYFVLVIFVFAYMYFYISYTAENYARTFAYENQEIYADNINGLINNERALLNESNYDGIVSNNTISFNGNTYQLNDSLLSHYDLAIFDDYLFVINNPYFKALLIKFILTCLFNYCPTKCNLSRYE